MKALLSAYISNVDINVVFLLFIVKTDFRVKVVQHVLWFISLLGKMSKYIMSKQTIECLC